VDQEHKHERLCMAGAGKTFRRHGIKQKVHAESDLYLIGRLRRDGEVWMGSGAKAEERAMKALGE
jgi:hypothetical protein